MSPKPEDHALKYYWRDIKLFLHMDGEHVVVECLNFQMAAQSTGSCVGAIDEFSRVLTLRLKIAEDQNIDPFKGIQWDSQSQKARQDLKNDFEAAPFAIDCMRLKQWDNKVKLPAAEVAFGWDVHRHSEAAFKTIAGEEE